MDIHSDLSSILPTTGTHCDPEIPNTAAQWGEWQWREGGKTQDSYSCALLSLPADRRKEGKIIISRCLMQA